MLVDSLDIGSTTVTAKRADLYRKGKGYELRAEGVTGLPPLKHPWPAVTVRVNGDAYEGRVYVEPGRDGARVFGLVGEA